MRYYSYKPDSDNFFAVGCSSATSTYIGDIYYKDADALPTWTPLVVHGFDDNPPEEGDFPSFNDFCRVPILSQRAWNVLQPLIGHTCEVLPIIYPTGKLFFILHVLETTNCLDTEQSVVRRYSDGGIMRVTQYALNSSMLVNKHIIKLPHEHAGDLIVDDVFRSVVEKNKLKGLKFTPLSLVE